jgi:hypothetical protein
MGSTKRCGYHERNMPGVFARHIVGAQKVLVEWNSSGEIPTTEGCEVSFEFDAIFKLKYIVVVVYK